MFSQSTLASLKDRLPYRLRLILGQANRRLRYAGLLLTTRNNSKNRQYCSVCNRKLVGFVIEGKLCPFCTSFPRHRLFWPMIKTWLENAEGPVRLMHVAPEPCLRKCFLESTQVDYVGIDRFEPGHYYHPSTEFGDIEALDSPDSSFDLVICLHVLEHVNDDSKALNDLFRVTVPGGCALFAFPFREGSLTFEDSAITDPDARTKAFGQWDHLRVYGEDVADRMRNVGYTVEKLHCHDVFDADTIHKWGLCANEVFFICQKPGAASSLVKALSIRPSRSNH